VPKLIASDRQSGSDQRSIIPIPNPNPNPSRYVPNNFSFNSLLSFRSPIWTYNYPI